jgi:signal peptidase I
MEGEPSYTFKQNYYWMMGDNRHNSKTVAIESSSRRRPHSRVKPVFIWMSIKGINDGIKNWVFDGIAYLLTVSGEGQPQSYFVYFLITLAAFFIGEYFWKKKLKTAN